MSYSERKGKKKIIFNTIACKCVFMSRKITRTLISTTLVIAAFGGVAYLSGFPPPQRFFEPQKTEFQKFQDKCDKYPIRKGPTGQDGIDIADRGHLQLFSLVNPILSDQQKAKMLRTYCAELFYREAEQISIGVNVAKAEVGPAYPYKAHADAGVKATKRPRTDAKQKTQRNPVKPPNQD
jgi:hypothetical protein